MTTVKQPSGRNWWLSPWVLFDLETTGTDPFKDRMVQWALVAYSPVRNKGSEKSGLVNPGVAIPEEASGVHGITAEHLEAAPRTSTALTEIYPLLRETMFRGMPVVGFNVSFDLTMLRAELLRHGYEEEARYMKENLLVIDPLVIDRRFDKYRKGPRKLVDLCKRYEVSLVDAHDAAADAWATGRLLAKMAETHRELLVSLHQLHHLQRAWYDAQTKNFQEYLRRVRKDDTITLETGWPFNDPKGAEPADG